MECPRGDLEALGEIDDDRKASGNSTRKVRQQEYEQKALEWALNRWASKEPGTQRP
jgi:hypothetical protein